MEQQTFSIQLTPFQAGCLITLISESDERTRTCLAGVTRQMAELLRQLQEAAGVTRKLLPDGQLELTDRDGNRLVRPPYPWEVGGNSRG